MNNSKKKQCGPKGQRIFEMRCPYCGKPVHLIPAGGILPPWSKITQLLACTNYPACDSYVCVYPGTNTPMGSIANKKLRLMRQAAHNYFDQLHTSGHMSRDDAYAWLADKVWRPRREAHIGFFGEYHCELVIEESKKLLAQRRIMDGLRIQEAPNYYERRMHA